MKAVPAVVSLVLATLAIAPARADAPAAASSVRVQLIFADSPVQPSHSFRQEGLSLDYSDPANFSLVFDESHKMTPDRYGTAGPIKAEYPRTLADLRALATERHVPVTLISGPAVVAADGVDTTASDEKYALYSSFKTVSEASEHVDLATVMGYALRVRPNLADVNAPTLSLSLEETAFVPAVDPARDADQIVHRLFSGSGTFPSGETHLLGAWNKNDGQTHLVYATVTLLPPAKS